MKLTIPKERPSKAIKLLLSVLFGILYLVGVSLITVCAWYRIVYDLEFKELLYTLASPLKGTGQSTVALILLSCLPIVLAFALLYVIAVIKLWRGGIQKRKLRRAGAVFCALLLVGSMIFSVFALRIPTYLRSLSEVTTIYEEYYADPDKVLIGADGKTKNLIYIYLESMEVTYASEADGGAQHSNFMPNLTALAHEYVSFSDKEGLLGGFHSPNGTGWTMAALLATTAGIPFSFPVGKNGHNSMVNRQNFASGLTALGDILEAKGYRQEFLCGSDADFGGRRTYFEQHGNYEIFDLFTAREEGYIAEDYKVWWGYEDEILYRIAKDELLELAAGDEPFNFTMLTADAHHVDGYVCDRCSYRWGNRLANVISCTDAQLSEFVEWCMEQDFYEDTVIVITGDHPRMDTTLVSDTDFDERTVYNCFINAAVAPMGDTEGRVSTAMDLFPTTLAAMGFTIEGDRLGLGVNLFSATPTLAEQLGYSCLEDEISKYSPYYVKEFS